MANWVVLVCAVLASLASGVLFAYGICLAMFSAFRVHSRSVASKSVATSAAARRTAIAGN
ncbi:MAG: hypothetical protein P4L10_12480 [Acidobacteriaceae bacterium]|jgi:hypothetical protein|nr:hypothetical protein [Acidobacteriaceae bacterium]